jgi:hypothetical protein
MKEDDRRPASLIDNQESAAGDIHVAFRHGRRIRAGRAIKPPQGE